MAKNPHILALNEIGQSVWYDNLAKRILDSGELQSLIDSGVSGLTSNPTIFKNAIADSSDYDQKIKPLADKGLSTEELCEDLMIDDVGRAADLLLPIYKATGAGDGYASIEVSPFLARDGKGTVEAAKRIWKKLNRPNAMIKIPATLECIDPIQEVLEAGINVNVTLIFSVAFHEKVMEAYIKALETRAAKGLDIKGISSVASYFVSRVDAICEKSFDELVKAGKCGADAKAKFLGKIGIANSKVSYARFKEVFGGDRFKALEKKGARVQRPLWASTGTKNPAFSPVMYVEGLAGRDTVNTMPPATLKALLQNASIEPNLHADVPAAGALLSSLRAQGVPFDKLMDELQAAGVKLFADAYQELLNSIETKRKALGV